jgi:hypothetical protein
VQGPGAGAGVHAGEPVEAVEVGAGAVAEHLRSDSDPRPLA